LKEKKSILVLVGSGTYLVNIFTQKKRKEKSGLHINFTIYSQVYPINLVSSWMNVIAAWMMMPLSQEEERVALALIHLNALVSIVLEGHIKISFDFL
jgi:hypothetical protein